VCSCYALADDLHTAVTCVTCKSSVLPPSPTGRDAAAGALPLSRERTCGWYVCAGQLTMETVVYNQIVTV